MKLSRTLTVAVAAAGTVGLSACAVGGASGGSDEKSVTIYSADGLHDGSPNWYQKEFKAFTKETGIKVQYVEAGSGEVVSRVEKEKANPQADVLATLPPFMQQAAADGLLEKYDPKDADSIPADLKDSDGRYTAMMNNYASWIYNSKQMGTPPATWQDLLKPEFKGKLQYSTPGEAGDGTAVLINAIHIMGGEKQGLDFLAKLEHNNVGPSSSTGKLAAKVNHGDLHVANGDVQMNTAQKADNPNIEVFIPADGSGTKVTFANPYYIALVKDAPQSENGKKLIDFLLAKKAQQDIGPIGKGFSPRQDVHATPKLKQVMDGVKVWEPDWNDIAKRLPQLVSKWQQATKE